jgi:hypothetical protein
MERSRHCRANVACNQGDSKSAYILVTAYLATRSHRHIMYDRVDRVA